MNKLIYAIRWELINQLRNQIVTIAFVIALVYTGIFYLFPEGNFDQIVGFLIFSDPAMLGFMFVGVLVLFEKGAGTIQALTITPMRAWQYLWAKAISLTLLALPASLLMTVVGHGWAFNAFYLITGVAYASLMFVFVGFIGVARTTTLNQYMVFIPLFLTPMLLPAFNYFGLTDSWIWYLIPSQGALILLEASFRPMAVGELIYAFFYPLAGITGLYYWALHAYQKHIVK